MSDIDHESDEIDPEHYLGTLFHSPVEGYTVERAEHHVTRLGALGVKPLVVYNPAHKPIGYICYDPQDDVPPEAVAHWKNMHYFASALQIDPGGDRFFKTFNEAALWLINLDRNPSRRVAEALLEAEIPTNSDDVDLERYIDEIYPGITELKTMLAKFYDQVKVHVREPTETFWENEKQWVVACRRDRPMPYPRNEWTSNWSQPLSGLSQGAHFRVTVENFFNKWAYDTGLDLNHFETYGTLRKTVTFVFRTRPKKARFLALESDDTDDPETFFNQFVEQSINKPTSFKNVPVGAWFRAGERIWQKDPTNDLPPTYQTGTVKVAPNQSIIGAQSTFNPEGIVYPAYVRPTQSTNEAVDTDDPDDPESFLPGFIDKYEWEHELMNLLWKWHPAGVSFRVYGTLPIGQKPGTSIVVATTYFQPTKNNFTNNMYDLVLNYFREHNFSPTSLNMWTWKQAGKREDYPCWAVIIVLNSPWNPALTNEPPVRSLT